MTNQWGMASIREEFVMNGTEPAFVAPTLVLTPPEVIAIVCDADYWRTKGLRLRADQHAIPRAALDVFPWITDERVPHD